MYLVTPGAGANLRQECAVVPSPRMPSSSCARVVGSDPPLMTSESRSILITGGAGFIGCELSSRLIDRGDRVTVMDVLHPQVHHRGGLPERLRAEVTLLPVDVTSPSSWDATLRIVQPDCIVHLAAETGTGQSLTEASRHGSTNVVGTTRMTDALGAAGTVPSHILVASSRAVYGEGQWTGGGAACSPEGRSHADLEAAPPPVHCPSP